MRVALALLLLAVVADASAAQSRYLAACVASGGEDSADPITERICGCSAEQAIAQGVTPAALDQFADLMEGGTEMDLDDIPEAFQPAAETIASSLMGCAFSAMGEEMARGLSGAMMTEAGGMEPNAQPSTTSAAPAPVVRRRPPAYRITQSGAGAAIRIRG